MSTETVFSNAVVVTRDETFPGSVCVAGGVIKDVSQGASRLPSAVDCTGHYLIPGLVDIHTDNLEKHLEPRPGVAWPALAAMQAHDRMLATAGVTTVLDSLVVGDMHLRKPGRQGGVAQAKAALEAMRDRDLMKADHRLHLRAEIASETVLRQLEECIDDPLVALVSLMDHTPGQRQWRDIDKWKTYYGRFYSPDELNAQIDDLVVRQKTHSAANRDRIAAECRTRGITLASHDDTTEDHVAEARRVGATISEFPTTRAAAAAAQACGMATLLGSPNVVKGGSHSGNVAAAGLAEEGLLDGLASDYVPISMIHSAFVLHGAHGIPLPRAVAMITANPAAMVGLGDRGAIAPGLRADLVRVAAAGDVPAVMGVWREGRQVA